MILHPWSCADWCIDFSSAENARGRGGAQWSYTREVFFGEEIFNRARLVH